jgi:hypothetical protein
MNNYKELSFLISSLFVIYFFKDIITTLIILVILSSISALLAKVDNNDNDNDNNNNYNNANSSVESTKDTVPITTPKPSQKPPQYKKSPDFHYNK